LSRTKNKNNAQAASLGHGLEEIGIDRMTSSSSFFFQNFVGGKKANGNMHPLKKRNCKAFNAIIQN